MKHMFTLLSDMRTSACCLTRFSWASCPWKRGARVQVLGLWGMGGIGKTTLAAKLFNVLLPGFGDAACFLEDVRSEAGQAGGLAKLQQKLLKALTARHDDEEDLGTGAHPDGSAHSAENVWRSSQRLSA